MSVPVTDSYEFNQMVAEAKAKLGREPVLEVVKAIAAEFDWSLPPEGQAALLLQLAIHCRGH